MLMMNNRPKKIRLPQAKDKKGNIVGPPGGAWLNPGINEVDDKYLDALLSNKRTERITNRYMFRDHGTPPIELWEPKKHKTELSDLDEPRAITKVNGEKDVERLKGWLLSEPRPAVAAALEARISARADEIARESQGQG